MAATKTIRIDSDRQISSAAAVGAAAIRAGQLVAFATETVYGIASLAANADAMRRLRKLKSRPKRPFTVHLGDSAQVRRYVADIPAAAQRLIDRAWPGPVTMLLQTGGKLADAKFNKAGLHDVLASRGMIGLRCPSSPLARAMLAAVDEPVVAPSANPLGAPSARSGREVLAMLNGQIDLLIDSGPTRYGKDSTIVRLDGELWSIVREGVLDAAALAEIMKRQIIFVCTGNTCRSPMAVGLAEAHLADRLSCAAGDLSGQGWQVGSAGVAAVNGIAPTPEAIHAAKVLGADIAAHRSRLLTKELINEADMVFCMMQRHVADACRLVPAAARKVRMLDAGADIPDPIGGDAKVYRKTAKRIRRAVQKALEESST